MKDTSATEKTQPGASLSDFLGSFKLTEQEKKEIAEGIDWFLLLWIFITSIWGMTL